MVNAAVDDHFAIGVLPMGTLNALARCLGLPLEPIAAARLLLQSRPRPYRPLQIAGRVALCFVSAGYDARVVHAVEGVGGLKRWIGKYAYVVGAVKDLAFQPRVPVLRVSPDMRTPDGVERYRGVLISRIVNYAGFPLFPAMPSHGDMLQWHGLTQGTPMDLLRLVLNAQLCRLGEPRLAFNLDITSADGGIPLHFQADGEAIEVPEGTAAVSVAPRPVQLLAPPVGVVGLAFDDADSGTSGSGRQSVVRTA
jgi:diacylglycerol kinase family enzyme